MKYKSSAFRLTYVISTPRLAVSRFEIDQGGELPLPERTQVFHRPLSKLSFYIIASSNIPRGTLSNIIALPKLGAPSKTLQPTSSTSCLLPTLTNSRTHNEGNTLVTGSRRRRGNFETPIPSELPRSKKKTYPSFDSATTYRRPIKSWKIRGTMVSSRRPIVWLALLFLAFSVGPPTLFNHGLVHL
ncbi:hypothetical protein IFR05_003928 [Cadophora sp. M221]|nr:hypothetical protein IFR05_003928 [Cadophora sp. M221]